MLMLTVSG